MRANKVNEKKSKQEAERERDTGRKTNKINNKEKRTNEGIKIENRPNVMHS